MCLIHLEPTVWWLIFSSRLLLKAESEYYVWNFESIFYFSPVKIQILWFFWKKKGGGQHQRFFAKIKIDSFNFYNIIHGFLLFLLSTHSSFFIIFVINAKHFFKKFLKKTKLKTRIFLIIYTFLCPLSAITKQ